MKRSIIIALVAAFAASAFASSAVADGTHFTYTHDLGRGGVGLTSLATVMASIDSAFSGVKGAVHSPVADVAALKAVPATGATARADRQIVFVDAKASLYVFDAASVTAGNDDTVVAPTSGTGRWHMLQPEAGSITSTMIGAYAVTLGQMAPSGCTDGQVPKMNAGGTTWECGAAGATYSDFTGDTGTGGVHGLVPAPGAGDAAAGKMLAADGAWHELATLVGDTGSGGSKGLVPAPATGDAAAGKFLKASGAWAVAMEPVVPLVAHSIVTLAGTTGMPEDSQITTEMFPFIKRIRVSTPADGNAHDTLYTIPTGAVVLDAWAMVATPDADPPGLTIDFGVNGNTDGFLNDVDVSGGSGGTLCVPVLDGTSNWYVSTSCGDLLATLAAGTNADDRGLFEKHPTPMVGGSVVAYQASAASSAVVDLYLMLLLPQ